jgi:HAD superfamily hydrolase (TIGR01509 family)
VIRALIFDFDGTILDTETADYTTWCEIYEQHGAQLTMDAWSRCIGTTYHSFHPHSHLERLVGRALDADAIAACHHQAFLQRVDQQQVLPGIVEWLDAATERGLLLAVASSGSHTWVDAHLERLGLAHYFATTCCAEDVTYVKPDPELYLLALRRLGIAAEEAIAIEDSPNGAVAAKRAGLHCIAVPNSVTRQLPHPSADHQMETLQHCTLDDYLDAYHGGR